MNAWEALFLSSQDWQTRARAIEAAAHMLRSTLTVSDAQSVASQMRRKALFFQALAEALTAT